MGMKTQTYYTREELAEQLKVSIVTIDRWTKKGLLKGTKIMRTVRFAEKDVKSFLEKRAK